MAEFAFDLVQRQEVVDPDETITVAFGPPTPGTMRVLLSATEALGPDDIPPPGPGPGGGPVPPGRPGRPGGTPGGGIPIARQASSGRPSLTSRARTAATQTGGAEPPGDATPGVQFLRRAPLGRFGSRGGRVIIDGGGGGGGGGGGEPPPRRPIAPTAFAVEVLDNRGNVRASGRGPLTFEVPEPSVPGVTTRVILGVGAPWSVRITNTSRFRAALMVNVHFRGNRPILTRDIDLDFLNEKLDLLFNTPELEPFRIAFVNVDLRDRDPRLENFPIPIVRSFIRLTADPEVAGLLGADDVEVDLGERVFAEETTSFGVRTRATVHDGSLAFKLSVDFPSGRGKIDVLAVLAALGADVAADVGKAIVDLTPADRPIISIRTLGLDLFLVLRPSGISGTPLVAGPHFEIVARPRVELSPSFAGVVVDALMQVGFERLLPQAAGDILRRKAFDLLGWLLGQRGREVTGSDETLSLDYAGDERRPELSGDRGPRPEFGPLDPGNLRKIDHIVVLMMENRSFDHMLGFLSLPARSPDGLVGLGRSEVDGLSGDESNPLNVSNDRQRVFPLSRARSGPQVRAENETRGTRFPHDPGHNFENIKRQRGNFDIRLSRRLPRQRADRIDDLDPGQLEPGSFRVGPNEGFLFDFARRLSGKVSAPEEQILRGEVMGYHPAEHVPTYRFLAEEYAVCDRWFAAHPGPTWPNRFITLTGSLAPGPDGRAQLDNPDIGTFDPLEVPTIFDHLSEAGVSWRYYEHDFAMLRLFSKYTFDTECIVNVHDPERGFFAAARSGRLPAVSFIDPDLIDVPPGNDDHPPADIADGQALVKSIYDALTGGPAEQWRRTLFLVVYDEHGGFFDHVHPPSQTLLDPGDLEAGGFAPLARDPETGEPIDHTGMRVPALVASPWIARGSVAHQNFDHTTILKTIMARFLSERPPWMGFRAALANDLGPLLSLSAPRRLPPRAVQVQPPDRRFTAARRELEQDDFRRFVTEFRRRVRG